MRLIVPSLKKMAKKIRPILNKNDGIDAAYLLGSIVSGRMHPHSDIDLAILPVTPGSYSTLDRLELAAHLQDALSYRFDIGVLGTHDVVFAAQAILKGECIFFRDRYRKDLFAATCLSLYVELKRQRAEVENAYRT